MNIEATSQTANMLMGDPPILCSITNNTELATSLSQCEWTLISTGQFDSFKLLLHLLNLFSMILHLRAVTTVTNMFGHVAQ